jgi:hypothetical protein
MISEMERMEKEPVKTAETQDQTENGHDEITCSIVT